MVLEYMESTVAWKGLNMSENNLLAVPAENQYQQYVFGTWGSFNTRAGSVDFLETKARLANRPDTSPESRLTQFLRPVREALPVAEMNFSQLLQRDLDDHRVAVELVPYLLTPERTGPAFFPPIVACLLPFSNGAPEPHFPPRIERAPIADIGRWRPTEFGTAFRFDRLLANGEELHPAKLGRVSWNPESAELVIIDGQHRAMALLAIDRTINRRWTGKAEKYKSFYEPVVSRCLEGMSQEEREAAFAAVELPITVIWFPEIGGFSSHHQAARKVFVDLNKNARPPSASRLLLLSDNDLVSVFTRVLLNGMRSDGSGFPIYGVEYDNPERDQASGAKWSALTNVSIVSDGIRRLVCGPEKFFSNMSSTFGGRDNETQMRLLLQESLDLVNALPDSIDEDDRTYSRDEIDSTNFPVSRVAELEQQFTNGWGYLLQRYYGEFRPFKVHAACLREVRDGWVTGGDSAASLAKEAIFEGVGLYWTLRESDAHWRNRNQILRDAGRPVLPRTEVINGWETTVAKKGEFAKLRAKYFLGSASKVNESEGSFGVFGTAACQIGFILAARSVGRRFNVKFSGIRPFADAIITAANAGLSNREQFISKSYNKSLNLLPKLDTPYSVYFRYFWLELLNSNEASAVFQTAGYSESISELVDAARAQYRSFLIKELEKAERRANPDVSKAAATAKATKDTDRTMSRSLKAVFGMIAADYAAWSLGASHGVDPDSTEAGEIDSTSDSLVQATSDEELDHLEEKLRSAAPDGLP